MARHPWVARADEGIRFGVQLVVEPEALPGLLETGRLVEALGFDALFVFDHPSTHADPWVCLPALAAVTGRVRLGSAVNSVPYRHPAHLARLAADLDNLSGGRLVLGVGIGWYEPEFAALDLPMRSVPERQAALEEALAIVAGVWGPEPFSFSGAHYRTEGMRVVPPPVQRPPPPILIGGGGDRTLRQVARFADACNVSEGQSVAGKMERVGGADAVRRKLDVLRRHCDEVGRPDDEVLRTHFTLRLVMASTAEALAAKLTPPSPTSASPGTRRAGASAIVVGTPEQVLAYYREMVEVGVQYFVVQLDARDHETLTLLAEEVMPRVG